MLSMYVVVVVVIEVVAGRWSVGHIKPQQRSKVNVIILFSGRSDIAVCALSATQTYYYAVNANRAENSSSNHVEFVWLPNVSNDSGRKV